MLLRGSASPDARAPPTPPCPSTGQVSIVPRSNAGGGFGSTFFSPDEATLRAGVASKARLEAELVVALGGRAAEEAVFGPAGATTAAADDLAAVARIARAMVESFGMAAGDLGPVAWRSAGGGDGGPPTPHSAATADVIDGLVDAEVGVGFLNSLKMATGTAVFGTLLTNGLNANLGGYARAHGLPPLNLSALRGLSAEAQSHAGAGMNLPEPIRVIIAQSVTHVFLFSLIVVALSLAATLMIPELPMRARAETQPKQEVIPPEAHV